MGFAPPDGTRTGHTPEDHAERIRERGDDPEGYIYYITYSDVYHTRPDCPHIHGSDRCHVARSVISLPDIYGVAGDPLKLEECGLCARGGGADG